MDDLDRHLTQIVQRDAHAFGQWIAGAEHDLRRLLRPFATRVDAEAVLQEALLRVWQVAPRVVADGKPNGLLRLAVQLTLNLARSEARRLRPELLNEPDFASALAQLSEAPHLPDPLLRKLIALCREKLPAQPARALVARLTQQGEPDERLAESLGMKLNTFLQNFGRARKLLAECLGKRGVDLAEVG